MVMSSLLNYSVGLLYAMLINMVDFQSSNVDGHVDNDILIFYVPCFLPQYLTLRLTMAGFTARRFSAYSARAVLGRISISAFSIINSGGQAERTLAHAVSYDRSVIPLTARILFMSSVKQPFRIGYFSA